MSTTPLSDAFLAARGAEGLAASADLELALESLCARGEAAWPTITVAREALVTYVGTAPACREIEPADLSEEAIAELYLGCACRAGDAEGLARFDARYLGPLAAAIAHMKLDAATVDEVKQIVRQKLLVAEPGAAARIERYVGQGKLGGLIQVVAVRSALDLIRRGHRERPASAGALGRLPSPEADPELQYLKENYRAAFRTAFEAAARRLSSRERNLLRLHMLDGVTLEQLAGMYDVHRATVVRWLAKAREALLRGTEKDLKKALGVETEELAGLMKLIESRYEVSVERMLQTIDASGAGAGAHGS